MTTPNDRTMNDKAANDLPVADSFSTGSVTEVVKKSTLEETGVGMGTPLFEGTMIQGASPPPTQANISLSGVQIPEVHPDYEVIHEIARGGMGVVYKARNKRLHRDVALKMILPHMLYDNLTIERFYQEARAAASLDHPNIVPIYEIGEIKGQHFFTMAFIEGESLRQLIKRQKPTVREAVDLLIGIADGVGYAHKRGIIHRDMKPENVLIDHQGRPRVTDFGLAKQLESNTGLTATGQIMGTPSYMSPEQALGGKRVIGPPSDVYALGAILCNLLTGRAPFEGDTVTEVLCKVMSEKAPSLHDMDPNVPPGIEAIYQKCMAKDPAQRYADAHELRDALQAWTATADNAPTAPNIQMRKPLPGSMFMDTMIPGTAITPSMSTMPSMSEVAPESSGKPKWLIPVVLVAVLALVGGIFLLTQGKKATNPDQTPLVENQPGLKEKISEKIKEKGKEVVEKIIEKKESSQVGLVKADRKDFGLKVEIMEAKAGEEGVLKLKSGKSVSIQVTPEKDSYLTLWSLEANGDEILLYPNEDDTDRLIKAGETVTLPVKAEFILTTSAGIDQLLAIASNRPFDPIKGEKVGAFKLFHHPEEKQEMQKQRGIVVRSKEIQISQEVISYRAEK